MDRKALGLCAAAATASFGVLLSAGCGDSTAHPNVARKQTPAASPSQVVVVRPQRDFFTDAPTEPTEPVAETAAADAVQSALVQAVSEPVSAPSQDPYQVETVDSQLAHTERVESEPYEPVAADPWATSDVASPQTDSFADNYASDDTSATNDWAQPTAAGETEIKLSLVPRATEPESSDAAHRIALDITPEGQSKVDATEAEPGRELQPLLVTPRTLPGEAASPASVAAAPRPRSAMPTLATPKAKQETAQLGPKPEKPVTESRAAANSPAPQPAAEPDTRSLAIVAKPAAAPTTPESVAREAKTPAPQPVEVAAAPVKEGPFKLERQAEPKPASIAAPQPTLAVTERVAPVEPEPTPKPAPSTVRIAPVEPQPTVAATPATSDEPATASPAARKAEQPTLAKATPAPVAAAPAEPTPVAVKPAASTPIASAPVTEPVAPAQPVEPPPAVVATKPAEPTVAAPAVEAPVAKPSAAPLVAAPVVAAPAVATTAPAEDVPAAAPVSQPQVQSQVAAAPVTPQAAPAAPPTAPPNTVAPQTTAAPISSVRSPTMLATITRADERVRHAIQLAEKGAMYASRKEFTTAISLIAQARDVEHGTRQYSQATAAGFQAIKEASDFLKRGSSESNLTRIVAGHKTPVLKQVDVSDMPPTIAAQYYYNYAKDQLAAGIGRETVGSIALYGLGKLVIAGAGSNAQQLEYTGPAMALYQAALICEPQNFRAAHELGVLLAGSGQLEMARELLMGSIGNSTQPTMWKNLAVVHSRLGEQQLATAAQQRAEALEQTAPDPRTPAVQWVDPATFANLGANGETPPAKPATVPAAAEAQDAQPAKAPANVARKRTEWNPLNLRR